MVNIFIVGSYEFTAKTLDKKRKLKQAIELKQIIDTIKRVNKVKELKESKENKSVGWSNHPVVKMWYNYPYNLTKYYNIIVKELINDGFNLKKIDYLPFDSLDLNEEVPWFINWNTYIFCNRSMLYLKDPIYYKDKFEFPEKFLKFGYIWPCRHSKEYYLENENDLGKICDKLAEKYINCRYCKAVIKTGKNNKGNNCGNLLKNNNSEYCGIHKSNNLKIIKS